MCARWEWLRVETERSGSDRIGRGTGSREPAKGSADGGPIIISWLVGEKVKNINQAGRGAPRSGPLSCAYRMCAAADFCRIGHGKHVISRLIGSSESERLPRVADGGEARRTEPFRGQIPSANERTDGAGDRSAAPGN